MNSLCICVSPLGALCESSVHPLRVLCESSECSENPLRILWVLCRTHRPLSGSWAPPFVLQRRLPQPTPLLQRGGHSRRGGREHGEVHQVSRVSSGVTWCHRVSSGVTGCHRVSTDVTRAVTRVVIHVTRRVPPTLLPLQATSHVTRVVVLWCTAQPT